LKCKNHKLNKGALIETVNSYKPILDWLTVDTLKQQLTRRYDKHKKTVSKKRGDESTVRTDVSELTEDSFPPISITTATATITSSESSSIVPIPPPPGASPSDTSRNKGGRPKGSTTENAIHVKKCIAAAKNEITIAYHQHMTAMKANGKKSVQKGAFQKIHNEIKKKETYQHHLACPIQQLQQGLKRESYQQIQMNMQAEALSHHYPKSNLKLLK
jgi:hypothetical protein